VGQPSAFFASLVLLRPLFLLRSRERWRRGPYETKVCCCWNGSEQTATQPFGCCSPKIGRIEMCGWLPVFRGWSLTLYGHDALILRCQWISRHRRLRQVLRFPVSQNGIILGNLATVNVN